MKTLRHLVAVGLLMGSYHVGMAQSNSTPTLKSEAEKQEQVKRAEQIRVGVRSEKAEVKENAANVSIKADAKRIDMNSSQVQVVQEPKVRVSNTHKAVPANYKPTVEETKPSDK